MIELTYDDLDCFLQDALDAFNYAELNFDSLCNRPVAYTLFGPDTHGIGAASPSHLVADKERKLALKTRRRSYTKYELDNEFQLLSNRIVDNGSIDCSYYHFDLNGVHYARGFSGIGNTFYTDVVYCLKVENQMPIFYAEASPSFLYIEFYSYRKDSRSDEAVVTSYMYYPNRKSSDSNGLLSRDFHIADQNSPISISSYSTIIPNICFSRFFSHE